MHHSREHPSPRYRELVGMYREMHLRGASGAGLTAEQTFDGQSLLNHLMRIKSLIERTAARTILDYGSGKGTLYRPRLVRIKNVGSFDSVMDYWGVDSVACYDPAYPPFSTLPAETFDGVICTDVMEHCPEEDIPWIVEELFSFARRFLFVNAACYPASKLLPNGENAHCTVRPPDWWVAVLREAAQRHPEVFWELRVDVTPPGQPGRAPQTHSAG